MNAVNQQIKLTVPNDIKFLPVIIANVSKIAELMGFGKDAISKIELGTEEAVANVLKHAFEPGEKTVFNVIMEPMMLGLKIIIKEDGIPFDPTLIPEYKPEDLASDLSGKGLGTYLMKQFIDKVSFYNLGKEGKETHLFKYLNDKSIEDTMNNQELEAAEKEQKEESLPRNSVQYSVRRMLPEEAVDVSKGAYSSYGYSYVLEHIYFPDRVREMNKKDELISFVAVTEENEIIGHVALEIEEADKHVPQLGVAFTKPKYRGQGCMNRISDVIIKEAYDRNYIAIYARGVTTHPFSQKSLQKFDFKDCALCLSSGPERVYKGIEEKPQRESVILFLRYLHIPKDLIFYPPSHHKDMIEEIYNHLGVNPVIKIPDSQTKYTTEESSIDVLIEPHNMVGKIKIDQYGVNVVHEVYTNLRAFCLDKIETIYLYLKLNDPCTATLTAEFEKIGFFFSGVMPGSEGKDMLILQYLNNYIIDHDRVQIVSEMGKKISEYVKRFDPNLNK